MTAVDTQLGSIAAEPMAHDVPVIVMNMFHSGLAIARDLAGTGVRVIGLSADKSAPGNWTRHCEVRTAPNSQSEPEQMRAFLEALGSEFPGAVVFPTRDADVRLLDVHRTQLGCRLRLAIPPIGILENVADKAMLAEHARAAGVPTPATVRVRSKQDLERVAVEVGFPCVIKPVSSVDWRIGGNWARVGQRKAIRVNNSSELGSEYAELGKITPEVLVQSLIPGKTSDIVVLGAYVGANAEILSYFTGRKLIQSPDDFGTGCAVASEDIPEIVPLSERLFRQLNYRGMAEVEFKRNAGTGEFELIEINTRHWDQHQLGKISGVNLSWVAYRDLLGEPVKAERRTVLPGKWIAEDALFVYTLRGLWRGTVSLKQSLHLLRGEKIYGIISWRDPLPAIRQAPVFFAGFAKEIARKLFSVWSSQS